MREFKIQKNDAGQRMDKFVSKVTTNLSGPLLYKYLRKKAIKVNGKKQEISYRLQENDVVSLYINDEFFPSEHHEFLKVLDRYELSVLYEDENILLADKKPGLIVHEDEEEKTHTLINYILAYLYKKGEYDPKKENSFTPALCNRIDKNTGGIVIAAKNAAAGREIYEIIKNRQIDKYYLTLVHGKMSKERDILHAYHKKDAKLNQVYISDSEKAGYKPIKTGYKVLDTNGKISLLEVRLYTGRTHQIRAHLAHISHPLVGDTKYGTKEKNAGLPFTYQALYAYKLKFNINNSDSPLYYLNQKEFTVPHIYFEHFIKEGQF